MFENLYFNILEANYCQCGKTVTGITAQWTTESHKPIEKQYVKTAGGWVENDNLQFIDDFPFCSQSEWEYVKWKITEFFTNGL